MYSRDRSGPSGTELGRAERSRTAQDEPGPRAPKYERIRARGTNQSPERRIRVPQDESGPEEQSGPRWTNQGPAGPIRAPQNVPGPHGTNQGPPRRIRSRHARLFHFNFYYCNEFGLGLSKNSGPNPRSFLFWGYPGYGPFARLTPPKRKSCGRPCQKPASV